MLFHIGAVIDAYDADLWVQCLAPKAAVAFMHGLYVEYAFHHGALQLLLLVQIYAEKVA